TKIKKLLQQDTSQLRGASRDMDKSWAVQEKINHLQSAVGIAEAAFCQQRFPAFLVGCDGLGKRIGRRGVVAGEKLFGNPADFATVRAWAGLEFAEGAKTHQASQPLAGGAFGGDGMRLAVGLHL